jgi:hypothetical protein
VGPILNTVIGAGIKLGCNLINSWLEQKRQDQMLLAARDNDMLQALIENQHKQASDAFVKATRRILIKLLCQRVTMLAGDFLVGFLEVKIGK